MLLYDEAENLLESRMLKANEVVDSGERLSFQAYLVDVCEPNPSEHSVQHPKPLAPLRPSFKKPNLANSFASKSLSPSHKMIRGEFSCVVLVLHLQSVKIDRCSLLMFSLYFICSFQKETTPQVFRTNSRLC